MTPCGTLEMDDHLPAMKADFATTIQHLLGDNATIEATSPMAQAMHLMWLKGATWATRDAKVKLLEPKEHSTC